MSAREGNPTWETTLAVEGAELDIPGRLAKVVVGVVKQGGVLHIAVRVGDETVLLPTGIATQLLVNLRRIIDYKLQADR